MKKIDSVQIKMNGNKRTYRSDEEKVKIVRQVDSSDMKKSDSCFVLGVTVSQVSVWRKQLSHLINNNTVKARLVDSSEVKKHKTDYDVFLEQSNKKIEMMITDMFEEWKKTDIICVMKRRITDEMVKAMARELKMEPDSIILFLDREIDLPYTSVDRIFKYVMTGE